MTTECKATSNVDLTKVKTKSRLLTKQFPASKTV